jgi:hypothetical protein
MSKVFKALPILLLVIAFASIPLAIARQSNDEKLESGELVSVDMDHQTLTIKNDAGDQVQFQYTETTKVVGSQNGIQGLSSKAGTRVSVYYKPEEDRRVATKIEILKKIAN